MKFPTLFLSTAFLFAFTVNAQDLSPAKQTPKKDTTTTINSKNIKKTKVKTGVNQTKVTPANTTVKGAPVKEPPAPGSPNAINAAGNSNTGNVKGDIGIPEVKGSIPVIKEVKNGSINWTQQYITAKGSSVLDTARFKNPAQARMMATRGAVVVAQRNLLEIIKGVEVTGETTVQDMVATSDYVYSRVDGLVKGAQQVGEAVVKEGMVEVTMRVPLYETNGLAPALYDNLPAAKESGSLAARGESSADTRAQSLEKIAFNLAGKKINPSMFPLIVDENNNVVFDMSKIYDPKSGKFPKIVQVGKEILKDAGYSNAVKVLDVLDTKDGKIVLDNDSVKKVNWSKIGKTAASIGKFLMMLL